MFYLRLTFDNLRSGPFEEEMSMQSQDEYLSSSSRIENNYVQFRPRVPPGPLMDRRVSNPGVGATKPQGSAELLRLESIQWRKNSAKNVFCNNGKKSRYNFYDLKSV